jgi:serine/threonine protein kinase
VIALEKIYKTHSNYYIFTSLCNGGDLNMLKKARGSLTEHESRLIMKQLVQGLKDLFESDIVHRDLKLANIMLNFKVDEMIVTGDRKYT